MGTSAFEEFAFRVGELVVFKTAKQLHFSPAEGNFHVEQGGPFFMVVERQLCENAVGVSKCYTLKNSDDEVGCDEMEIEAVKGVEL